MDKSIIKYCRKTTTGITFHTGEEQRLGIIIYQNIIVLYKHKNSVMCGAKKVKR